MNANYEIIDGNADTNASYINAEVTHFKNRLYWGCCKFFHQNNALVL